MRFLFLSLGTWWLLGMPGRAAEPPEAPRLRIEAGMHTARIGRIASDVSGRIVLTCSDDKTARLWRLEPNAGNYASRLLRVFRPPIGQTKEGMLNACALDSSASIAAVGGWTGTEWDTTACIYLFDATSGRLLRRLTAVDGIIMDLAFSGSGRFLAAALGGQAGLKIWEVSSGRLVARDPAYGGASYSVDWFRDEKLVAACDDGRLRLYRTADFAAGPVLKPAAMQPTGVSKRHNDVHFSPDGGRVLLAYADRAALTIHSGTSLAQLQSPDTSRIPNGQLTSAGWLRPSRGGFAIAAGGTWREPSGYLPVRIWSAKENSWVWTQDANIGLNTLMNFSPLPADMGGGLLWSTAHPSWGMLAEAPDLTKPDGPVIFRGWLICDSPVLDFRTEMRVSADASTVLLGNPQNKPNALRLLLAERSLEAVPQGQAADGFLPAKTDGLPVTNWQNNPAPSFGGQLLKLRPNEISRSLAIAGDASFFVLGTEFYLRCYQADGREKWSRQMPGTCWRTALSADGGVAVAACSDGTLRWHRTSDGAELVAAFPHGDKRRWVAWTPRGYYDCSADGENLIGWHVNRGKHQSADFFPAGKFRDRFYEPDVPISVLRTRDETNGLRQAMQGKQQLLESTQGAIIAMMQPPVVELAVGGSAAVVTISPTAPAVEIRYRVRRSSGEPVTRVRILVDGRPVSVQAPVPGVETETASVSVPVPNLDCLLAVLAENRYAASVPAVVRIARSTPAQPPQQGSQPKARLLLLSVGISDYSEQSGLPDLRFAAKDGRDFAACLQRQEGGLYQKVEFKILTDGEALAANILDGLDWLRVQATPADVCAVLFAGHGENDADGRYYFCPHDYDRNRRLRTAVSLDDIRRTMGSVPGKVLFFVDTCHSGNALGKLTPGAAAPDINRVVNVLSSDENGAVLFAASTGRQSSQEHGDWQNGAFTKAVVEGISGSADILHNGRITVASLETYVAERVRILTGGTQTPTVAKPQTVPDFAIALKR